MVTVAFGQLLPVVAEHEPVVDHLRKRSTERSGDPPVYRLVRPVVGPADDVCDAELEIVDDGCQLIGGGPVCSHERRSVQPDRAVGVAYGTAAEGSLRCSRIEIGTLALAVRAFVPGHSEPRQILQDRYLAAGHDSRR